MEENKVFKEIVSWTKTILIAFTLALLINTFLLQTYIVRGDSMVPTLHNNDFRIILKMGQNYGYGDIVIIDSRVHKQRNVVDNFKENRILAFITGEKVEHLWVKRVIAKEYDTLQFIDGNVYRNGELLEEPYLNERMINTPDFEVVIPAGHIYVMGDNRNESNDSRSIGSIPLSNVVGKLIFQK